MSYQVLARKWRPRTFRQMVGQEHVLKALMNALDLKRLHHAYLFTGTRGVGKTSIARILAKCLNCERGIRSEPCEQCSACKEISEGRYVDLIEVDAASRTKVEDTRELLENVQYSPTRGSFKIYLIDEVHMLSNHSFNALLKTLEEPPEHVKFLLATTDPQKLPATILSRCLQFNLKNMPPEKIVAHLQDVLAKEAIPFEEPALWHLARSADGSMRDALSLTDQAISYGGENICENNVVLMLGAIDHNLIQKLIGALVTNDGKQVLQAVANFAELGPDFDMALADLLATLHRIAIAQTLPDALNNSQGDRTQIMDFAGQLAPEDVQLFYQTALIGRRDLHLSADPRAGFEMTLLRMLAFKPQGLADVPSKVLASQGAQNPVEASAAISPASEAVQIESKSGSSENTLTEKPMLNETVEPALTEPVNPVREKVVGDRVGEGMREETMREETMGEETDPVKKSHAEPPLSEVAVKQGPGNKVRETAGKEGFTASENTRIATGASALATKVDATPQWEAIAQSEKIALEQFTPENWNIVYSGLGVKGILQSTVANCVLLERRAKHCFFALDESKGSLYDPSHARRLAELLGDYFEQSLKVDITLQFVDPSIETPARHAEKRYRECRAAAIAKLRSDPFVQKIKNAFGAVMDEDSVVFK